MLTLSRTLLANSAGSTEAARDQLRKRAACLWGAQVRHVGDGWGRLCGWRWWYECAGRWCWHWSRRLWLSSKQLTLSVSVYHTATVLSSILLRARMVDFYLLTYYISFSLCFYDRNSKTGTTSRRSSRLLHCTQLDSRGHSTVPL